MKVSVKIHYNRRKRLKEDKTAPVEVEIYYKKKRFYVNTGVSVKKNNWSVSQCKVVKLPNSDHLNRTIHSIVQRVEKYESSVQERGLDISMEDLKSFLTNHGGSSQSLLFSRFADAEIDRSTSELSTIKRNRSVVKIFKKLMGEDVVITKIDYNFLVDYAYRLKTVQGLSDNSIVGHHKVISKFLNIAKRKGVIAANPYEGFTIGGYTSTREALTFEEVAVLEEMKIPISEKVLAQVRDMFLFSCYTGLRFSDMQALTHNDVVEVKKGVRLKFVMKKVNKSIEIPLYALFEKRPEEILYKYADPSNQFIFPEITNQAMNRNLKSLMLKLGTGVKLTSHVARHTFGTMLADLTQNPYLIMQLMGHSKIQTSMIYIHLSQKRLENQLENVKWGLL